MKDDTLPPITPDDMFRERIVRSRRMTPNERGAASLDMYDLTCAIVLDGVFAQIKGASEP